MKKWKNVYWICLSLAFIGFCSAGQALHGQDIPSDQPMLFGSYGMWQILYTDAYGKTHRVYEDGSGNTILTNDPKLFLEAVDARVGRFVFTLRFTDSVWRIFSAKLDMSDVRSLASLANKNIFLQYDLASKRVLFALNQYDAAERFGTFYSVPIAGDRSPVKLAQNVVWCDIVGDRFVYSVEPTSGNRNLVSIKLDGTGKTNLTWNSEDEWYSGKINDKVIYSRKVNGQADLYIIPNYGGTSNLKALAVTGFDEVFTGVSPNKVYYLKNDTRATFLFSVNLDGSGTFPIVSPVKEYVGFLNNYIIYLKDNMLATVRSDGANQADLFNDGGRWRGFFCTMEGRAIYNVGGEWSESIFSVLPSGVSLQVLYPKLAVPDTFYSNEAKRIVMYRSDTTEMKSIRSNGSYPALIGSSDTYKKYLFSTSNRHVFAEWSSTNGYWILYSEGLNSGYRRLIGENLALDVDNNIKTVLRYCLTCPIIDSAQ